ITVRNSAFRNTVFRNTAFWHAARPGPSCRSPKQYSYARPVPDDSPRPEGDAMSKMTPLLKNNEVFADSYTPVPLAPPAAQVVVLTCVDHRLDPEPMLGIQPGDALVFRNAGGRVNQSVIEEIAYLAYLVNMLSGDQEPETLFEIAVIHHNQCGTGFLGDPD